MEDKVLNEKDSLELISRMIKNTQNNVKKGEGRPFLIWGYTTVVLTILVWYMVSTTHNNYWHGLWFLLPMVGLSLTFLLCRDRTPGVKTYIDRIVNCVWIVCGGVGFTVSVISWFDHQLSTLYIIVLLMGIGTTLTGLITRFNPIVTAGVVSLLLSFLCLFVEGYDQLLVFAAVFVAMMVVPGHILNYYGRKMSQMKNESSYV